MKITKTLRALILLLTAAVLMNSLSVISAFGLNFTPTYYDEKGKLQDIRLYSESVYMINMDTGETIVDINGDVQRSPASMTKIMTAVVLLDEVGFEEETLKSIYVSAGTEAFDELYDTGAATADIQPYEKVSYYDLLAALLIPSACEAANIIAINVGGSVNGFVDLMNAKAKELGLDNTHFSNAHGLFTQQNYSTARDIAVLSQYALEHYSVFRELVSLDSYQMEPTDYHEVGSTILNTNLMLNNYTDYYYAYCKGIKTGTTDAAGRCLSSYAVYDGVSYLIVTMNAPMDKLPEDVEKGYEDPESIYGGDYVYYNILDHINLYEWAYSMLVSTDFINENSEVRDVKVAYGRKLDYANLKPANGYSQMWPVDVSVDDVEKIITVKENIVAPVEKGDVLGTMELRYHGETLAEIDLISTTKVERSPAKSRVKIIRSYFSSRVFRLTMIIIISGLVLYGAIHFVRIQRKYLRKYNDE